jgi:hypothetical protein
MTSKKKYTSLLWKCPICLDTLEEPILASCCGQSFCKICLDAALCKVDACPMCRQPLLNGQHSCIKNRALEDLLTNIKSSTGSMDNTTQQNTDELILIIQEFELEEKRVRKKRKKKSKNHPQQKHLFTRTRQLFVDFFSTSCTCHFSRQIRQWQHWCRIHWSSIQCVFYVFLFFFFVFFLRVQEEEFAEHQEHEKQETKTVPTNTLEKLREGRG